MVSKKFKCILSGIITVVVIMGTLAGCSSKNSSDSSKVTDSKKLQPFTIWCGWAGSSTDDNWQQSEYWKKQLGFDVHIEYTQAANKGDITTALNLKMNSGGFDDMALFEVNNDVTAAMSKSGLVQPADDLIKNSKYPNLNKIPKDVLNMAKSSDGKNWYIPSWYDQNTKDPWKGWASNSWWINTDVLAKAGVKETDFGTLDGVEESLKKISKISGVQPLGFIDKNYSVILNSFGVDTLGVKKVGNDFIQPVDDPNYKKGIQYIAKLTREGLVDKESLTQKSELFKQKVTQGKYGVLSAGMWDINSTWEGSNTPDQSKGLYLKPIKGPKVDGVSELGASAYINPYASFSTFISKDTKHLDSILAFLNWAQTPKPDMQLEFAAGAAGGPNWEWKGEPNSTWDFKEPYKTSRMSSDQSKLDKLKSGLDWQLATYSKQWYPWWTHFNDAATPKGYANTAEFTQQIASFGSIKPSHAYTMVTTEKGGAYERYSQVFNTLCDEYIAKLILSKSDGDFEAIWTDFSNQLEKQAHWTDMKKDWKASYDNFVKQYGDF